MVQVLSMLSFNINNEKANKLTFFKEVMAQYNQPDQKMFIKKEYNLLIENDIQ